MKAIFKEIEIEGVYTATINGMTENGINIGECFILNTNLYKGNGMIEKIANEKKQGLLNLQSNFTKRFLTESLELKIHDSIGFSIDNLNEIINQFKNN